MNALTRGYPGPVEEANLIPHLLARKSGRLELTEAPPHREGIFLVG
jgi:hypothetical protein